MKYTTLITVMRQLNAERRKCQTENCSPEEQARIASVHEQMRSLLRRAWLVRSAVLCLYGSVVFFLLASFAIGAAACGVGGMDVVIIALFVAGLLLILLGTIYAYREARLSYDVVAAEVRDLEQAGVVEVPRP